MSVIERVPLRVVNNQRNYNILTNVNDELVTEGESVVVEQRSHKNGPLSWNIGINLP